MADIRMEIRRWLLEQPDWLQEAADRLLKQRELSAADLAALSTLIKTTEGRAITTRRSFDELSSGYSGSDDLRLTAISDVVGIEGLAPRRPLHFGDGNLTVVYGHNGSGKSGYTRILKRASGKPRSPTLKANVFEDVPSERRCCVEFRLGNDESSVDWNPDGDPIDAIRSIDIFDTEEASHYLSKESVASYTPPMVALFESLANACDQVKAILQSELDKLISALPQLPAVYLGTKVGQIYAALRPDMADAQVRQLITWSQQGEQDLSGLVERLKATDPATLAMQKRATKVQAEKIISLLERHAQAFSGDRLQQVRLLKADAREKRKVAVEGARVEKAELEGVGSETWRAMWEAARTYSQVAYPNQIFPVTDGARCVFCHQELGLGAKRRLHEFETFVQGKLEAAATAAEDNYREALAAFPQAPSEDQIITQCQASGLLDESVRRSLVEFWCGLAKSRAALLTGEVTEEAQPAANMAATLDSLRFYRDQLEAQAGQYDADALVFDRAQAEREKLELEAQRWISLQADAVRKEIARLKSRQEFEGWKSLTNSRKISLKAGEIAEKLITDAYVARFNKELSLLGATRIKVRLVKTRTERGRALHKLQLVGSRNAQATPDSVLSEGERRVISLAAFLADMTDKPWSAPFVFDDPISSLDQVWEERVIERLVSLSETRQVIVFTHRLSLLGIISEKASAANSVHIRSEPWGAGEVGEVPLYGKNPEKALNDLKLRRLAQARKVLAESGRDAYYPVAKAICSDLRILMERFVESTFLADVVQRHRRAVNTKGKIHDLLKIEREDCDLIDELMTKYSRYEHSQSTEAPVELPEPEELLADVDRVLSWHVEFKKRSVELIA